MEVQRGDIVLVNLGKGFGSEQGGIRPALVLQNDIGNIHSPTTIIAPITTKHKRIIPTHYWIKPTKNTGLKTTSLILFEQIRVIDKKRIITKIGHINISPRMEKKIKLSLSLLSS